MCKIRSRGCQSHQGAEDHKAHRHIAYYHILLPCHEKGPFSTSMTVGKKSKTIQKAMTAWPVLLWPTQLLTAPSFPRLRMTMRMWFTCNSNPPTGSLKQDPSQQQSCSGSQPFWKSPSDKWYSSILTSWVASTFLRLTLRTALRSRSHETHDANLKTKIKRTEEHQQK